MNQIRRTAAVLCLFALTAALPASSQAPSDVTVNLELSQQFYYAGDPLPVRISVGNNGSDSLSNPVKIDLSRGFKILKDGKPLERADGKVAEPTRPSKLAPLTFYGAVVDLASLYPGLGQVGSYSISWEGNGVRSQELLIKMLPKYDPAKRYEAEVQTSMGNYTITFAADISPIAVKAFVDMANADFYDALPIHEVRPKLSVAAGDAQYAPTPRRPFLFPAEKSSRPVLAGTVILKPAQPSPPANSSQFVVMLRPEPALLGQVTVLGQVTKGLDVVKRISEVASSAQTSRPAFKPLKDVTIRDIVLRELPAYGS